MTGLLIATWILLPLGLVLLVRAYHRSCAQDKRLAELDADLRRLRCEQWRLQRQRDDEAYRALTEKRRLLSAIIAHRKKLQEQRAAAARPAP